MNKLRLDTRSNLLVLTTDDGSEQYYRPTANTALELFIELRELARDDPAGVPGRLDQDATMVEPPTAAIQVDPAEEPSDEGDWEGAIDQGMAAADDDQAEGTGTLAANNELDPDSQEWFTFGNLNNLSTA